MPHRGGDGSAARSLYQRRVAFTRGEKTGAAVQIDHIVPLALAWDLGARFWSDDMRLRFANDPANLIAVAGEANQDKGDHEPATWMPPNTAFRCQYAIQFIAVLRGYALPIDAPRRRRFVMPPQPARRVEFIGGLGPTDGG